MSRGSHQKTRNSADFEKTISGPTVYWEFHERGFHQAIRRGDWKGVRHGTNQPLELYYLRHDLAEKTNVATLNATVVKELEASLANARTASPHWPATNSPPANP